MATPPPMCRQQLSFRSGQRGVSVRKKQVYKLGIEGETRLATYREPRLPEAGGHSAATDLGSPCESGPDPKNWQCNARAESATRLKANGGE
jgi:hypothetical protein